MKTRSKPQPWPRVVKGKGFILVEGRIGTARHRKRFRTLADAERYASDLRALRADHRAELSRVLRNDAVNLGNLSDGQRADVRAAFALLDGRRETLTDAVRFFITATTPTGDAKPIGDVMAELLAEKRATNRRERTIRNAEARLRGFAYDFQGRPISTITTMDIARWIDELAHTPATRNVYLVAVRDLFSFAVRRGWIEKNPALAVPKATVERKPPEIFTVRETRKLLDTAAAHRPELVPFLAIGLFAGLRPENELRLLDWGDVNLKERQIRVTAATAKKRRQRFVEISDNLADWLLPHRKAEGRVSYSRRMLRDIIGKAGLAWSPDVMRHSFASYHLAEHEDAAKTAMQLGHSGNADVLFQHYRELVRPKDAAAFWKITPKKRGRIIPLSRATA